jgi:hypothetical protein
MFFVSLFGLLNRLMLMEKLHAAKEQPRAVGAARRFDIILASSGTPPGSLIGGHHA